jgi:hypothetical protein
MVTNRHGVAIVLYFCCYMYSVMNRYIESVCKSGILSQNETKGTTNNVRFNRRAQTSICNWFLDCLAIVYDLKTLYDVEWYIEISWVGMNFEKKWSRHILWYYPWTTERSQEDLQNCRLLGRDSNREGSVPAASTCSVPEVEPSTF